MKYCNMTCRQVSVNARVMGTGRDAQPGELFFIGLREPVIETNSLHLHCRLDCPLHKHAWSHHHQNASRKCLNPAPHPERQTNADIIATIAATRPPLPPHRSPLALSTSCRASPYKRVDCSVTIRRAAPRKAHEETPTEVNVRLTLAQATRPQRGSRCIAKLFL